MTGADIDPRYVDLAVAGAPELTHEQIMELRRALKPELLVRAGRAGQRQTMKKAVA